VLPTQASVEKQSSLEISTKQLPLEAQTKLILLFDFSGDAFLTGPGCAVRLDMEGVLNKHMAAVCFDKWRQNERVERYGGIGVGGG